MKQADYTTGVVSIYRKYIDQYLSYGKEQYHVLPKDEKKLFDLGNRVGFTNSYFYKKNDV